MPPQRDRQQAEMLDKRVEYRQLVDRYFQPGASICMESPNLEESCAITVEELAMRRQIYIDVIRTKTVPDEALFQCEPMQQSLQRILFLWAVRHPASGYVQGMNDLCTPFLYTFLPDTVRSASAGAAGVGPVEEALARLPPQTLSDVEADTYWHFPSGCD
eukprot:gene2268-3130_t